MPTAAATRVTRTRSALRSLIEAEVLIEAAQSEYDKARENELAGECLLLIERLREIHRAAAGALDRAKHDVPSKASPDSKFGDEIAAARKRILIRSGQTS